MKPPVGTALRALVVAALVVVVAAVSSCSDGATAQACTGIPAGGCPISSGLACEDPACAAVYACRSGNVWELDRTCAPRDAGSVVDASSAFDAPREAAPPFDASIDAPPGANGGPGCAPLQPPDCTLGFALACSSGCCGCEDLFVCDNGGWSLWSTCKE